MSCINDVEEDVEEIKNYVITRSTVGEVKEIGYRKVFRGWVDDTLSVIYSEKNKSQDASFQSMDIIQSTDSLEMILRLKYAVKIPSINYSAKAKDMLSFIEELDEVPQANTTLYFDEVYSYYPSVISEMQYGYTFEFENIRIVEGDLSAGNRIEFGYIRGMLTNKICEQRGSGPL